MIVRSLPSLTLSLALLLSVLGLALPSTGQAQDGPLKIGVIDMQDCLTQYYRTNEETEKLNETAKEKRVELDARNADYMKLNKLIADEDKRARATELPPETRNAAIARLQELLQERAAKQNEIQEFQRRIQAEMMQLRTQMESTLVDQAKDIVTEVAEEQGLDMVHDSSFLPRANKAIVYISPRVVDITESVVAKLNVDAPPPAPAGTEESAPDADAAPTATPEGDAAPDN